MVVGVNYPLLLTLYVVRLVGPVLYMMGWKGIVQGIPKMYHILMLAGLVAFITTYLSFGLNNF